MGTKTVLGFIAGFTAGAILGILFAPESGSATRGKIAKKSGDFSDAVKDSFNEFIDNLKNAVTKTNNEAGDWVDTASNNIKLKLNEGSNPSPFPQQDESLS